MKYELKHPIFCLNNVTAGYDGKIILKDLNLIEYDLAVEGAVIGQTICFVGRSGRGKSTLFKLITGLMNPMSGEVLINNEHSDDANAAKQVKEGDVTMVDQKYTLFRHKTVFETLMFSLRKSNKTKEEKVEMIEALLLEWGLTRQRNHYPKQLSGGQKQRVSILSKALTGKTFMVFDEPTASLDQIAIDRVQEAMQKFKSANELNTIIFSTHNLEFAVKNSDVIYVIGHEKPNDDFSTIVGKIDLRERGFLFNQDNLQYLSIIDELKEILYKS